MMSSGVYCISVDAAVIFLQEITVLNLYDKL